MDRPLRSHWFSAASPQGILVVGFLATGLLGGLLLSQPWAHARGPVSLLDSLFTATSALCVTGLIVVDTGRDLSPAGQIVVLTLIQVGGLGVITFAAFVFQVLGRRLSLRSQAAVEDALFQRRVASEFRALLRSVLWVTLSLELAGAALIFLLLPHSQGGVRAAYESLFHSVSAFCNAGFSLYSDSFLGLRDRLPLLLVLLTLIFLGGIGHPVLIEMGRWVRSRCLLRRGPGEARLSVHSRVVLGTSALLILFGTAGILVTGLTASETGATERLTGALFHSVSSRTAGFNTVDVGLLPEATLVVLVFLMFIGGSPASCAGGVKTTSLAVWLANLRGKLRGAEPTLFARRIPEVVVQRIAMLLGLAVTWNLLGLIVLLVTEAANPGVRTGQALFEQVSAFGTVGLSTGITPHLTSTGKLWIMATMYVGRLGPLTLAVWVYRSSAPRIRHPEGRLMIG